MKRTFPFIALLLFLSACTTFKENAGKFLASEAATVDASMKAWAIYVVTTHVSEADQAPIKALYVQYQAQMALAEKAYVAMVYSTTPATQDAFTTAQAALTNAELGLTTKITAVTKGIK